MKNEEIKSVQEMTKEYFEKLKGNIVMKGSRAVAAPGNFVDKLKNKWKNSKTLKLCKIIKKSFDQMVEKSGVNDFNGNLYDQNSVFEGYNLGINPNLMSQNINFSNIDANQNDLNQNIEFSKTDENQNDLEPSFDFSSINGNQNTVNKQFDLSGVIGNQNEESFEDMLKRVNEEGKQVSIDNSAVEPIAPIVNNNEPIVIANSNPEPVQQTPNMVSDSSFLDSIKPLPSTTSLDDIFNTSSTLDNLQREKIDANLFYNNPPLVSLETINQPAFVAETISQPVVMPKEVSQPIVDEVQDSKNVAIALANKERALNAELQKLKSLGSNDFMDEMIELSEELDKVRADIKYALEQDGKKFDTQKIEENEPIIEKQLTEEEKLEIEIQKATSLIEQDYDNQQLDLTKQITENAEAQAKAWAEAIRVNNEFNNERELLNQKSINLNEEKINRVINTRDEMMRLDKEKRAQVQNDAHEQALPEYNARESLISAKKYREQLLEEKSKNSYDSQREQELRATENKIDGFCEIINSNYSEEQPARTR